MFKIAAFYNFTPIDDVEAAYARLEAVATDCDITGSILVASEGVNGTIATDAGTLDDFVSVLCDEFSVSKEGVKFASSEAPPFRKLTVRQKPEIVASGIPRLDPNDTVGTYVSPERWDELIARDDVMLIDCRNSYEVRVGSFDGAIDPETASFREFADWAERSLDPEKTPRVAMFCTGGIRCEKATSLLVERGFPEVYHLEGGILRYLEDRGPRSSSWHGECFVFDRRVSVNTELRPGTFDVCWACRMPVSLEDKQHDDYEEGVSCHSCIDTFSEAERAKKRERHRQLTSAVE